MVRYGRVTDYLWILILGAMLYPVLIYSGHSAAVIGGDVQQGPLLMGRGSLDSLISSSRDRIVVVNFWATWCTPCIGELPHLDELQRSMEEDLTVIAVDIGDPRIETLLDFREDFALSMPVIWLGETDASNLKEDWQLPDVLPVTLVLDASGRETARIAGARDMDYFRDMLEGGIRQDTASSLQGDQVLHINVVGQPGDSLTLQLLDLAGELAGDDGVDFYDPSDPGDSTRMGELHLPFTDFSYAQPCIGSACGRLARTPEDLLMVVGSLSN